MLDPMFRHEWPALSEGVEYVVTFSDASVLRGPTVVAEGDETSYSVTVGTEVVTSESEEFSFDVEVDDPNSPGVLPNPMFRHTWDPLPEGMEYIFKLSDDSELRGPTGVCEGNETSYTLTVGEEEAVTSGSEALSFDVEVMDIVVVPPDVPPSFTSPPSVPSGSPTVGVQITGSGGVVAGSPPPTVTRNWMRGASTLIAGATSLPYVPQTADVGSTLKLRESAVSSAGGPVTADSNDTGVVVEPPPPPPPPSGDVSWMAPVARGDGSGNSYANAASISALPGFIAPGRTILLLADEGEYAAPPSLTQGGAAGDRCRIQGVDRFQNAMFAEFVGSRTNWTLPTNPETVTSVAGWSIGNTCFRLNAGVGHLEFSDIFLRRFGDAIYIPSGAGKLDDIHFENFKGYNVRRFFEMSSSSTGLMNSSFKNGEVIGFSKTCFRLQFDCHDVLYQDIIANSGRQDRDNFAMCFQVESVGHDITYRRCEASNTHSTSAGSSGYAQGDGFVIESGGYRILYEDCFSHGHTDGGWDIKGTGLIDSPSHILRRCRGERNKRNMRNWAANTQLLGWTGRDPIRRYGGGSNRDLWCGSPNVQNITASIIVDQDGSTKSIISAPPPFGGQGVVELSKGFIRLNNTNITKPTATPIAFFEQSGGGFSMDSYTTANVNNV